MQKKEADEIIENCWKNERQKIINTLLRHFGGQVSPDEIAGYVTDAFANNYQKLLRGGFDSDNFEEHLKKSIWRSAFNLMKNRLQRDKLIRDKEDKIQVALFPFFHAKEKDNAFWSNMNLECILEQFIKLSQDERMKVHMKVLSLVEFDYADENDVAARYGKQRRWVSDKLHEGKRELGYRIHENCDSNDW